MHELREAASATMIKVDCLICKPRIEALEAELAEANAKIRAARAFHGPSRFDGAWCSECEDSGFPCPTIRALADPAPQESHAGSLAGNPLREEKPTIYKCVCQFSGTNVKTRKDGDDDYWTCPGCRIEYGPVLPYGLGPQRPFAGNPLREENETTSGSPKKCEPTCVCKADWADGTGVCQECGLMRDEETA